MTKGPGDHLVARVAGHGHLRASDADRDQVIDALKTAFVQGRLTKDELAARAGDALVSRTYAELTAITADIPAAPILLRPPQRVPRTQARKPVNRRAVAWVACVLCLPPVMGAAFFTYYGGFFVLFLLAFIGATVTADP